MAKVPIAVLISGRGSNMAALLYASRAQNCPFEIVLVFANDPDAPGLALAAAEGIRVSAVSHKGMPRAAFDQLIDQEVRDAKAEFIVLAGFMRLLGPALVERWQGRILNIHPSLLPAYKGLDTHQRALDDGVSHSGCSVHLVTAGLDEGPVLGQTEVAILPGDTAESLAARILIAEHQLYPHILAAYLTRDQSPAFLTARIRDYALALPETFETLSHGMPCFGIIKGKKFAYISIDHHGDGRMALLVKISGVEEQAMLIERDPDRFYRPAYFGDGWIAIRLDTGGVDWDEIKVWIERSWTSIAPPRLRKAVSIADEF